VLPEVPISGLIAAPNSMLAEAERTVG